MGGKETFTKEQLERRIGRFRRLEVLMPEFLKPQKSGAGMERYLDTSAGRIRVLAYRMEDRRALPLFINIHGGGFVFGNADMDDPFMPGLAREADAKIISIDYNLVPEHPFPVAVEECYAVAQYAREHAAQLGVDPERIAMGGHSAGGQLRNGKAGRLSACADDYRQQGFPVCRGGTISGQADPDRRGGRSPAL